MYADAVFRELGSVIKIWITFNEPMDVCIEGYDLGSFAPLVKKPGIGGYQCIYNVLVAHAKAYHVYKKYYADDQRGIIGITLDGRFYYPKDDSVDMSVVDRALQFDFGLFAHPIYSTKGGFPEVIVQDIKERSKREGRNESRLPEMSEEIKNLIHNSADFLGFNYYSSRLVELNRTDYNPKIQSNFYLDTRLIQSTKPEWKRAKSNWLYSVPDGLRDALKWFKTEYNNIPVIITENGWSDDGQLDDDGRIEYLKSHLKAVSEAIDEGCPVKGYTMWSIIDNFEWLKGYTEHFGVFAVNLTSPNKERTAKKSAGFLKKVIEDHYLMYP
jgi:beta-glucosidase/6-phospho-beta-glucosidase/beta-galactosidase